ncbi:MAG TPA: SDR family NAD(P)-dependent oxidoreductase [Mycobacteriales bacterium]|nr:SDR family NAD(P)-dependent oxidoreductase [Mycobacteriales bacterium]
MELRDAVVLVTGASSGIGREVSLALAGAGARLLLAGRDGAALEAVARRTGGTALVADLATVDGARRLAAVALATGPVDAVVLNAGAGWRGPLAAMTLEQVDRLLRLNLQAPIELTRALLPGMLRRGRGHVLAVASIAGVLGVGQESVYAAGKAGLVGFADSLRYELAGTGVDVTVVIPGVVRTAFFDRRGQPYHRARPRPVRPERVARAIRRALSSGAAEVIVPRWLGLPVRLRALAPGLYRRLARRFG